MGFGGKQTFSSKDSLIWFNWFVHLGRMNRLPTVSVRSSEDAQQRCREKSDMDPALQLADTEILD